MDSYYITVIAKLKEHSQLLAVIYAKQVVLYRDWCNTYHLTLIGNQWHFSAPISQKISY